MTKLSTRRDFAGLPLATAIGMTTAVAIDPQASSAADTTDLRPEFLFDLSLTTLPRAEIGPERAVVAVSGGTFDGPRLKGTVIGPAGQGSFIVRRTCLDCLCQPTRAFYWMTRLFILVGATLSFGPTAAFGQAASPWPEADRIFHSDSRWLGSDGGFSIDLGNARVLWSFGDTLVVKKAGDTRKMAAFVHNTVAIETGYDPSTAQMKYYWRRWGSRMEIFPSEGKVWMWPSHGIRIDNRLVVFCSRIQNNPKKESLGFEGVGSQAFVIENPDAEPTDWKMKTVMKDDSKVMVGSAAIRQGNFIYVYCESEGVPLHDIFLARWKAVDFAAAKFDGMEWWNGGGWSARENRKPVMHEVSSELSVQANPRGGFVEVNSQGWGASDIVMRTAPKLEGPWSDEIKIYHPPEGDRPQVLTYAGKAHPELRGADLIITYGINGSDEADGNEQMSLYFPRFARMNWPNR